MKIKTYLPTFEKSEFHCPNCNVYSAQWWKQLLAGVTGVTFMKDYMVAECSHCKKFSIWHLGKMIYPSVSIVELPNEDLNEDILQDYQEAASILDKSPRGAAALLRLTIQKLCVVLGEKGKNINDDIKSLVAKGLPVTIQQALDYVRVVGNESVHPGQMDLKDNKETAQQLFNLINLIAEVMISQPKHIQELYNTLPADKLNAIQQRDK